MTATTSKNIQPGAWTTLVTGVTQATVQNRSTGPMKICVSQSAPSPGTTDYVVLRGNDESFPMVGLSTSDVVYAMPIGDSPMSLVLVA